MRTLNFLLLFLLPFVVVAQDPKKEVRTVYFVDWDKGGLLDNATEDAFVYIEAQNKHWYCHKLDIRGGLQYGRKKFKFRGCTYLLEFGRVRVIKLH